jgi:hypothetical protein
MRWVSERARSTVLPLPRVRRRRARSRSRRRLLTSSTVIVELGVTARRCVRAEAAQRVGAKWPTVERLGALHEVGSARMVPTMRPPQGRRPHDVQVGGETETTRTVNSGEHREVTRLPSVLS